MSEQTKLGHLEYMQREVGTGNGYRWVDGWIIVKPNGDKVYPPGTKAEMKRVALQLGIPLEDNL